MVDAEVNLGNKFSKIAEVQICSGALPMKVKGQREAIGLIA
jgi:hypothetical protein